MRYSGYIIGRGQIQADPVKNYVVVELPVPVSCKQLQQFLGFANFYYRFIRDYSKVAAPLTKLTSTKSPFSWQPEAQVTFVSLKSLFTSAPILVHPDPTKQFIVEVDASDSGVGAVLSQRCAFFSRRLTPAERNYDVGNRELGFVFWSPQHVSNLQARL